MTEFTPPNKPYKEWIEKGVRYAKRHNLKPVFGVYFPPNNDAKVLQAFVEGMMEGRIDTAVMQSTVAKCDKPKPTMFDRLRRFIFGIGPRATNAVGAEKSLKSRNQNKELTNESR